MPNKRIITALLFCAMMCGILSGCGSKGSAVDYVEGVLDVAYGSDAINDKALNMESEEITETQDEMMEVEASYMASYFNMETPSEEALSIFKEACQELYKAADYSVSGDGMDISVVVKPLIIRTDALEKYVEDFSAEKYVNAEEGHTDVEFAKGVAGILKEISANPEYEEAVTVNFTVSDGIKGRPYTIAPADLQAIDKVILAY